MPKRLVLAGAGHAHLYTLQRAAELVREGIEVVLVAPEPFWYSGLATGMLGGYYPPSLDRLDTGRMIERAGGRWGRDAVATIHPEKNSLTLTGGGQLDYDVLSLNLGSQVAPLPGARERVVGIKPIGQLARLREAVETAGRPLRLVVAGAGPSGCEIAANLRALQHRTGAGGEVHLLSATADVLPRAPGAVRRKMRDALRQAGVHLSLNARVAVVEDGRFRLEDGREMEFDFAVNATGLVPPALLKTSGLEIDADGAMRVDEYLRSVSSPVVFGGGDCISIEGRTLDKVGVYAIREAPVLFANLRATLRGEEGGLKKFRPQSRYLLILNLGDGTGLATWGRWHWRGRLAFRWKDFLDRRFLAQYRT